MKGLPGLIRLHRWKLDEERRKLAELQTLAAGFEREIVHLEATMREEGEKAQESVDAAQTYGQYLNAAIQRRDRLRKSIAEIEKQIAEWNERVSEAFQELKRYELAQAEQERKEALRTRRLEQIQQDEIGRTVLRLRATGQA